MMFCFFYFNPFMGLHFQEDLSEYLSLNPRPPPFRGGRASSSLPSGGERWGLSERYSDSVKGLPGKVLLEGHSSGLRET